MLLRREDVVLALLDLGADAGTTLGHRLLAAAGADVDQLNSEGQPPLHFTVRFLEEERSAVITAELLRLGANVNAAWAPRGITPLMLAACPTVVDHLLVHGADVSARDRSDMTCLHYSARFGRLNIIKIMLEHGADPNINMPLLIAERYAQSETEAYLKAAYGQQYKPV
ncbi:ankyrin repeat-containing domain protein [Tribonema minus]|uniref:Ankyrin repeat-containing domain protein n=1 Tax=Tribonema minus TaxID=303371 RepID=A0A836C9Y9_9STRA|nr:ankyrin repeat-containing domain protein [Tribonema minus]